MPTPWDEAENDLIVADYFAMLQHEYEGRLYSKADHNRRRQQRIGRSKGAIEYKHQNISAVLKGLGEVWLAGYLPAFNIQQSLFDAVLRWLNANPAWLERQSAALAPAGLQEEQLWVGPPPTQRNEPPPQELEQTLRLANQGAVAERDARNRVLGRAGEERVLAHERAVLLREGRRDLADQIRWISEEAGDGAGYDIESFEPDGRPRLIEVKTTNGWDRTPFYISRNELRVSEEQRETWRLFRLWDFSRLPKAFELRPPLEAHVSLVAVAYQASFH